MLKDLCCDRYQKPKGNNGTETRSSERNVEHEIENLFKDNTKMPEQEELYQYHSRLPRSGLSKRTIERLKIEFRFLKHVMELMHDGKID